MEAANGGPNADARVGPVGLGTGGLGAWIGNQLSIPASNAGAETKMMQNAINKLTPREREAFDSIMSSYSTIVGLRSLTRASAAQSSVSAIEREMPAIGLNTFSRAQFVDQLSRLAEVTKNGFAGLPPDIRGPGQASPQQLIGQINKTMAGLRGGGTTSDKKGTYKEGDTRNINGVTYKRDKDGQWHPQP
jgi:hypothetical protein